MIELTEKQLIDLGTKNSNISALLVINTAEPILISNRKILLKGEEDIEETFQLPYIYPSELVALADEYQSQLAAWVNDNSNMMIHGQLFYDNYNEITGLGDPWANIWSNSPFSGTFSVVSDTSPSGESVVNPLYAWDGASSAGWQSTWVNILLTSDGSDPFFSTDWESLGFTPPPLTWDSWTALISEYTEEFTRVIPTYRYFEDRNLKVTNIKESIDLIDKKFKVSTLNITISNAIINENRLSDIILTSTSNGIGVPVDLYFKTQSAKDITECIKVAKLKIARYDHDINTIKITAEDDSYEGYYKTLDPPLLYGFHREAPAKLEVIDGNYTAIVDRSYYDERPFGGIRGFSLFEDMDSHPDKEWKIESGCLKIKLGDLTYDVPVMAHHNSRHLLNSDLYFKKEQISVGHNYITIKRNTDVKEKYGWLWVSELVDFYEKSWLSGYRTFWWFYIGYPHSTSNPELLWRYEDNDSNFSAGNSYYNDFSSVGYNYMYAGGDCLAGYVTPDLTIPVLLNMTPPGVSDDFPTAMTNVFAYYEQDPSTAGHWIMWETNAHRLAASSPFTASPDLAEIVESVGDQVVSRTPLPTDFNLCFKESVYITQHACSYNDEYFGSGAGGDYGPIPTSNNPGYRFSFLYQSIFTEDIVMNVGSSNVFYHDPVRGLPSSILSETGYVNDSGGNIGPYEGYDDLTYSPSGSVYGAFQKGAFNIEIKGLDDDSDSFNHDAGSVFTYRHWLSPRTVTSDDNKRINTYSHRDQSSSIDRYAEEQNWHTTEWLTFLTYIPHQGSAWGEYDDEMDGGACNFYTRFYGIWGRRIWCQANVFEEDFFVTARGREGDVFNLPDSVWSDYSDGDSVPDKSVTEFYGDLLIESFNIHQGAMGHNTWQDDGDDAMFTLFKFLSTSEKFSGGESRLADLVTKMSGNTLYKIMIEAKMWHPDDTNHDDYHSKFYFYDIDLVGFDTNRNNADIPHDVELWGLASEWTSDGNGFSDINPSWYKMRISSKMIRFHNDWQDGEPWGREHLTHARLCYGKPIFDTNGVCQDVEILEYIEEFDTSNYDTYELSLGQEEGGSDLTWDYGNHDERRGRGRTTIFRYGDHHEYTGDRYNFNNQLFEPARELVENPAAIIRDILKNDLKWPGQFSTLQYWDSWILNSNIRFAFSVFEKRSTKEILENIARQSRLWIKYRPATAEFVMGSILNTYSDDNVSQVIDVKDVLSYNYDLTDIDDLIFSLQIDYKHSPVSDEFTETTDPITHSDEETKNLYQQYYNIYNPENYTKVIESDYIQDYPSAYWVRDFLFELWKHQHLIIEFTISIHHSIALEVGDIIKFNDNIDGLKAFGRDIHESYDLFGQNITKYYMITESTKNLNNSRFKCVRMHDLNIADPPVVGEPDFDDEVMGYCLFNNEVTETTQAECYGAWTEEEPMGFCNINGDVTETTFANCTGEWTINEPVDDILLGDVNGDGEVNVLDIVLLVNYILGTHELTGEQLEIADWNGDGNVDVLDVVQMVNFILGQ